MFEGFASVASRRQMARSTCSIQMAAKTAGTYWITTGFGLNACELRVANSHVVFFAGLHQRFKVHRIARPMFFVVPDERAAQINVLTESPDEPVQLRVRDANG